MVWIGRSSTSHASWRPAGRSTIYLSGPAIIYTDHCIDLSSYIALTLNIMFLAVAVSSNQLLHLGVGLSDISLLISSGRKIGNWLRVSANDDELLTSIHENPDAVLKRRDPVETLRMDRRWSCVEFIYQGKTYNNKGHRSRNAISAPAEHLTTLTWLMVVIVTALDFCLPSHGVRAVIMRVYVRVLDGGQELQDSLRVLLPTNVESWRSTGCVRGMTSPASRQ
jgi:hypothetical protein